jgi:hypothetical protein
MSSWLSLEWIGERARCRWRMRHELQDTNRSMPRRRTIATLRRRGAEESLVFFRTALTGTVRAIRRAVSPPARAWPVANGGSRVDGQAIGQSGERTRAAAYHAGRDGIRRCVGCVHGIGLAHTTQRLEWRSEILLECGEKLGSAGVVAIQRIDGSSGGAPRIGQGEAQTATEVARRTDLVVGVRELA